MPREQAGDPSAKIKATRVLRNNLPPEVKKLKHFLIFKFGPAKKEGGKPAKIPYYADGRVRKEDHGSGADRDRLVGFATAIRAFQETRGAAGIGLATLNDSNLTVVDIDRCVSDNGDLNELAQTLLSWNTYTEYSPSGTGLRMLFFGNMGTNAKNNKAGLELFCTKGYATLTGRSYHPRPRAIVALTDEQKAELRKYLELKPTRAKVEDLSSLPSALTDSRIRDVVKALKHVHPDCGYDEWIMVGQALHSGNPSPDGQGFKLWYKWSRSQDSDKFSRTSEEEMLEKWEGFERGKGITLASIFHIAKKHGYVPGYNSKKLISEIAEGSTPQDYLHRVGALEDAGKGKAEKLDVVCEGLMDHVGCYLFIGRAKIGKSRVLGLMTAAALRGGDVFGCKFTQKCRTLCVTTEESAHSIYERMQLYMTDPADYKGELFVVDRKMVVQQASDMAAEITHVDWLKALMLKYKPRFMYVDTLVGLRMIWRNEPEGRAMAATERDYQIVQEIEELGEAMGCAIVCSIHGSKRKGINNAIGFDPFEQIGTTSWSIAAAAGAFVIMDKLGYNPVGDQAVEDDGQRLFSVRGRYRKQGDLHLVIQGEPHGAIRSLGSYSAINRTTREAEILEAMQDLTEGDGDAVISCATLAAHIGQSKRTVKNIVQGLIGQKLSDGSTLKARRGRGGGYTLAPASPIRHDWE